MTSRENLKAMVEKMTEHDPTATDPDELPPKPAIEDMPTDEDVEGAPEPGEEPVSDSEFLDPDEAAQDDTVDDGETPDDDGHTSAL